MQITLCMIVKNESDTVIQSLLSVIDIIDNAVIADTGSTDNTEEIILEFFKQYNKPLLLKKIKWNDDFSEARNQVLEEVPHDNFVISLDADQKLAFANRAIKSIYDFPDYLEPLTRKNLESHIKETNGTLFNSINLNINELEYWQNNRFYGAIAPEKIDNFPYFYHNIFIKTEKIKYFFRIHETLIRMDENFQEKNIRTQCQFVIVHIGYSPKLKKNLPGSEHSQRNILLLKKSIADIEEPLEHIIKINPKIKELFAINRFENKKKLGFYYLENEAYYKDLILIIKDLANEFEILENKLKFPDIKYFMEKSFLAICTKFIETVKDKTELKISLCNKIIKLFSKRKKEYLPLFHYFRSILKFETLEFAKKEVLQDLTLALIPNNEEKFLENPVNFLQNWANNLEKHLLIYGLNYELNYYLPPIENYYKYAPLLTLGKYYFFSEEYYLSLQVLAIAKKSLIFAVKNIENDSLYKFHGVLIPENSIGWLLDYLELLKKISAKIPDSKNIFLNEYKWCSEFYSQYFNHHSDNHSDF